MIEPNTVPRLALPVTEHENRTKRCFALVVVVQCRLRNGSENALHAPILLHPEPLSAWMPYLPTSRGANHKLSITAHNCYREYAQKGFIAALNS